MAGPISYTIDGQQYVTVEAGWGGAFPLALGGISTVAKVKPEARVLTYKIGGNAKLPAPDPSPDVLPPPPPVTADAATANKGRDLYNGYCGMRSEEHTSELQSLMRISYAVFCLQKQT